MSTQPAGVPPLLHRGPAEDPPSGLSYPLAYRPTTVFAGLFGISTAFAAFVLFVPLAATIVLRIGHAVRGGDWEAYRTVASAYELPEGLLSGHLALASLTVVALLIARWFHGRSPRWVWSVQPGMRWRYLVATTIVAAVVLNGMLWLSFLWQGAPTFHGGQPNAAWFLAIVVVSSPLQALAEEVFFRGYLLQTMGSMSGKVWVGVLGSSLVFALMHGMQNPALFAHRFAFGVVAGLLVLATGGLEAGIAAHVVNNLGAFGYAIFTSSVAEVRAVQEITWAKAGWDILTFSLFALVAWGIGRRMRLAVRTP